MHRRSGIDAERFMAPKVPGVKYVVGYLPIGGCGVGPGGRGVLLPPHREFASLGAAMAADVRLGFRPWIAGPDGYYSYAFGLWQFAPYRKAA